MVMIAVRIPIRKWSDARTGAGDVTASCPAVLGKDEEEVTINVEPRGCTAPIVRLARRVAVLVLVGLSLFVVGSAPALAYTRADRDEQTRYVRETVDLNYSAFLARKADFTRAGCRVEGRLYDGSATPGCRKPSPYNAFDWTDDGCSGRENPVGFVISNSYRNLFNKACQLHDFGYRNFGEGLKLGRTETIRAWIDNRFRIEMYRICDDTYSRNRVQLRLCKDKAEWVWGVVRQASNFNSPPKSPSAPLDPSPAPGPAPSPAAAVFTVMNTGESPPDGVWFRNSPHVGDTDRVTGHGVYRGDRVRLECHAWGESVGAHANRLWYRVQNVTTPTVGGRPNDGFLNAHYVNDGTVANQVVANVRAC